jgi:hypothetical protein
MPKLKNASREDAIALAEKIADREDVGVNVYQPANEGEGVWYLRFADYPPPPNCECVAQVVLSAQAAAMGE